MECKFAVICRFCQQEDIRPEIFLRLPAPGTHAEVSTRRPYHSKTPVGGGSIKEKPGATVRHCKKCAFTATSPGVMCQHYRHEHPKAGKRLERPARGHCGGQKTSGMGLDAQKERLERENKGLEVKKDADVRHAFDILQARSNDSNLSRAAQKDFDKLEDETADLPEVAKWPTSIRGRVVKLYNAVVNGVTEEK